MSFMLYVFGFLVVIAGVAWAMDIAGIPSRWILITSLILLGLGILTGAARTRSKDPPA